MTNELKQIADEIEGTNCVFLVDRQKWAASLRALAEAPVVPNGAEKERDALRCQVTGAYGEAYHRFYRACINDDWSLSGPEQAALTEAARSNAQKRKDAEVAALSDPPTASDSPTQPTALCEWCSKGMKRFVVQGAKKPLHLPWGFEGDIVECMGPTAPESETKAPTCWWSIRRMARVGWVRKSLGGDS